MTLYTASLNKLLHWTSSSFYAKKKTIKKMKFKFREDIRRLNDLENMGP